jgi:hypothetical protein
MAVVLSRRSTYDPHGHRRPAWCPLQNRHGLSNVGCWVDSLALRNRRPLKGSKRGMRGRIEGPCSTRQRDIIIQQASRFCQECGQQMHRYSERRYEWTLACLIVACTGPTTADTVRVRVLSSGVDWLVPSGELLGLNRAPCVSRERGVALRVR